MHNSMKNVKSFATILLEKSFLNKMKDIIHKVRLFWESHMNAVISTNKSTRIWFCHVIYNQAYPYKFQLKTTQGILGLCKGNNFNFYHL